MVTGDPKSLEYVDDALLLNVSLKTVTDSKEYRVSSLGRHRLRGEKANKKPPLIESLARD